MRILNCMWSTGTCYQSVHKVMYNFKEVLQPFNFCNVFLIGAVPNDFILNESMSMHSSKKKAKGYISRLALRRQYSKIIINNKPQVVIVDGMGMARLLLPILSRFRW